MANYKKPEPNEVEEYIRAKFGDNYKILKGGKEIGFPCICGCDDDRRQGEEYHCNINTETGVWHCFKCDHKGHLYTLKKHFGDLPIKISGRALSANKLAEKCYNDLPEKYRKYFKDRGISDKNIEKYKLGYGKFNGVEWLTIPIIVDEECKFIKLRRLPESNESPKYKCDRQANSLVFGGDSLLKSSSDSVMICGGELDKIIGEQMDFGMPIITSTAGEATFKDEWIERYLKGRRFIYICLDNDKTVIESTIRLANRIIKINSNVSILKITIPQELGEGADLTDVYKKGFTAEQLLEKAELIAGLPLIDGGSFKEMWIDELAAVLDSTIKCDKINKVVIFLAMLLTYTDGDQVTVFLNSQSSAGKTHLVVEVSKYFPESDVKAYGKITPTAFYYDEEATITDESGRAIIDLSRKIMLFLDQVNTKLQENLRPVLSHDKKEIVALITNKGKNGANTSKRVIIRGFPSPFFCSANLRMDEQEMTRAILLSPEISKEKIEAGVQMAGERMRNEAGFDRMIGEDSERRKLMDRVIFIKNSGIKGVIIPKELDIIEYYKSIDHNLTPQSQRDIKKFISIVKAFALLNLSLREQRDGFLIASEDDVCNAYEIWDYLSKSQQYNIPPQILDFYKNFVLEAFKDNGEQPLLMDDIITFYYQRTGKPINNELLRKSFIPVLESAGLITRERSKFDGRKLLIKPMIMEI